MASMIHFDWGFILFTVLVFGAAAGALLCFKHMMHEGEESHKKPKRRERQDQHSNN